MDFPADDLKLLPVWTADVEIAPTIPRGEGPTGTRYVVPITGGTFKGALAPETADPIPFQGTVIPGGFDIQRERRDGVLELEAIYHMRCDDGVIVEIRNHAILTLTPDDKIDYARSRIGVEVPEGRYDWLNKRVIVGSIEEVERDALIRIRAFVLV